MFLDPHKMKMSQYFISLWYPLAIDRFPNFPAFQIGKLPQQKTPNDESNDKSSEQYNSKLNSTIPELFTSSKTDFNNVNQVQKMLTCS